MSPPTSTASRATVGDQLNCITAWKGNVGVTTIEMAEIIREQAICSLSDHTEHQRHFYFLI